MFYQIRPRLRGDGLLLAAEGVYADIPITFLLMLLYFMANIKWNDITKKGYLVLRFTSVHTFFAGKLCIETRRNSDRCRHRQMASRTRRTATLRN